jgi:hypothetical protein
MLLDEMQRARPAGLRKEVNEDVTDEGDSLIEGLLVDLVGGGFEGPVDEQGAAYDVLAWDEAPVAAVEGLGTVVAHGEDLAGGNYEVAVYDVFGEFVGPAGGDLTLFHGAWGNIGEVVAVGLEGVLGVAVVDGLAGLGLVLGNAVEVDDAVAEVDVVAGDADGALDEEQVGGLGLGLEEDDDVAAVDVAVEGKGCPFGGGREGDSIDEDVVADEQGADHRGRGDLEVLEDEGHDEEGDGEDGADGGHGLQKGLMLFGLFLCLLHFDFGCLRVHPSLRAAVWLVLGKCIA